MNAKQIELKARVLQWRAFQNSDYGRAMANKFAAELFDLTGEVLSFGKFVRVR